MPDGAGPPPIIRAMTKHPVLLALGAGLAILLAAFALPLLHMGRGGEPAPAAQQGLPWQVEPAADGTARVFGLQLGRDTLADARQRFGDNLQLALVARLGEVGALEGLVDPFQAGFVAGRLVLAFDVPADALARWRAQAAGSEPMEGGVRRFALRAEDLAEARGARIAGLSFVPSLRLSEADIRQRFGPPEAEQALDGGARLLLYPARGLTATVADGSRGVLQYVAPRDFDARLRAPRPGPAAAAASAGAS